LQWGKLSDDYGRRPIMLAGIIGTFISVLLFGFRSPLVRMMVMMLIDALLARRFGWRCWRVFCGAY
jgi:sugar phosphate permease